MGNHSDDDDDDDLLPADADPINARESSFTFTSPTTAWNDKLSAKASASAGASKRTSELSLAFSAEELSHMATSTGAARRKLKKLKKRADKAGAGLVGRFEDQMLDVEAGASGVGRALVVDVRNVQLGDKKKKEGSGLKNGRR